MLNVLGINVQKEVSRPGFCISVIIICMGCNKLPATLWVFMHGTCGSVAFRPYVRPSVPHALLHWKFIGIRPFKAKRRSY